MKIQLKNDIIIKTSINGSGVEVGTLPKNIGLECLRYDGEKIVNISELDEFYIDTDGILHVIQLPNTQKVKVKYKDRKKLKLVDDKYIVVEDDLKQKRIDTIRAKRKQNYPTIGDQLDTIWKFISKQKMDKETEDMYNTILNVKKKFGKE